jgi:hypothetical protein
LIRTAGTSQIVGQHEMEDSYDAIWNRTIVRSETRSATFCQRQSNADRWTEGAVHVRDNEQYRATLAAVCSAHTLLYMIPNSSARRLAADRVSWRSRRNASTRRASILFPHCLWDIALGGSGVAQRSLADTAAAAGLERRVFKRELMSNGKLTEGVLAVRRVRYPLRRGFQELKVPASHTGASGRRPLQTSRRWQQFLHVKGQF